MHQNDQKSLSWEIQGGKKVPKVHSIKEKKKKKKKRKPARLKTQKGGLGKVRAKEKKKKKKKKRKIGKSYQVGNLRMQPKKRRILQDESLEVWLKMNELKSKCWYKWSMKISEKMATKKWENSSNTWFLSNAYLGGTSYGILSLFISFIS